MEQGVTQVVPCPCVPKSHGMHAHSKLVEIYAARRLLVLSAGRLSNKLGFDPQSRLEPASSSGSQPATSNHQAHSGVSSTIRLFTTSDRYAAVTVRQPTRAKNAPPQNSELRNKQHTHVWGNSSRKTGETLPLVQCRGGKLDKSRPKNNFPASDGTRGEKSDDQVRLPPNDVRPAGTKPTGTRGKTEGVV